MWVGDGCSTRNAAPALTLDSAAWTRRHRVSPPMRPRPRGGGRAAPGAHAQPGHGAVHPGRDGSNFATRPNCEGLGIIGRNQTVSARCSHLTAAVRPPSRASFDRSPQRHRDAVFGHVTLVRERAPQSPMRAGCRRTGRDRDRPAEPENRKCGSAISAQPGLPARNRAGPVSRRSSGCVYAVLHGAGADRPSGPDAESPRVPHRRRP